MSELQSWENDTDEKPRNVLIALALAFNPKSAPTVQLHKFEHTSRTEANQVETAQGAEEDKKVCRERQRRKEEDEVTDKEGI